MPTDRYGRTWDYTEAEAAIELCPTCGQPDNCGDCTHGKLTVEDVCQLGGRPTDAELDEFEREHGYPPCPVCGSTEPDCEEWCEAVPARGTSTTGRESYDVSARKDREAAEAARRKT